MEGRNKKERAIELFKHGHNCAQAVACAYTDVLQVDDSIVFRLAEGFGGGVGGTGSLCGAASGMVMVTSLICCPEKNLEQPTKAITYAMVDRLLSEFKLKNRYMDCKDLLKYGDLSIVDGKKRVCVNCVASCCDLIDAYVLSDEL